MDKLSKAVSLYDELHRKVGYLCVTFADIEKRLNEILILMINEEDPAIGEALVRAMPFAKGVDVFAELAPKVSDVDPDEIQGIEILVNDLRQIAKYRNDIIHSRWYLPDPEQETFTKEGARPRKQSEPEQDIVLNKISETCLFADAVSSRLDDFKTEHWGWI